jgi:hypothetical protein
MARERSRRTHPGRDDFFIRDVLVGSLRASSRDRVMGYLLNKLITEERSRRFDLCALRWLL